MADTATLPSPEDIFGPAPGSPAAGSTHLPSADELFGPAPPPTLGQRLRGAASAVVTAADQYNPLNIAARTIQSAGQQAIDYGTAQAVDIGHAISTGDVTSSPATDYWFTHAPVGRVLDRFGYGAKQAWGTEPLGLSDDQEKALRDSGFFNDYASAHVTGARMVNEAVMRPLASAADAAFRLGTGAFAGTQAALAQAGAEAQETPLGAAIGAKGLGEAAAGFLETGEGMGFVHHIPAFEYPAVLDKARSMNVIGVPEAVHTGERPPTPAQAAAQAEATRAEIARQPPPPPQTAGEPAPPPVAADIHDTARQVDPVAIGLRDNLQARLQTFSRWIGELRETQRAAAEEAAPHSAADLDDLRGKIADATPRRAKIYSDRLADWEDENAAHIEESTREPSDDIRRVQADLVDTQNKLWDIRDRVVAAYRTAQEHMPDKAAEGIGTPANEISAVAEKPASEEIGVTKGQETPGPETPVLEPKTEAPPSTIAPRTAARLALSPETAHIQTPADIAADVSKKLQDAGRPKEEADASAQIIASHYEARAARLGGKRGTAAELYRAEAPEVRAGRVREMAQREGKTLHQENQPTFYSALERGVDALKLEKASADQWRNTIKNLPGLKKEELEWSGIEDFLKDKKGSITKAEVLEFLRENEVQVKEVEKGATKVNKESKYYGPEVARAIRESSGQSADDIHLQLSNDGKAYAEIMRKHPDLRDDEDWADKVLSDVLPGGEKRNEVKFGTYVLPGGENYRELLLTLPPTVKEMPVWKVIRKDGHVDSTYENEAGAGTRAGQIGGTVEQHEPIKVNAGFRSSHFDEQNILAHVRFDDRKGPDGEKVLHMAEVQSDWHQQGRRKGYAESPVKPDAPLVAHQARAGAGYYEIKTPEGRFVTNVTDSDKQTPELAIAEARRRLRDEPQKTARETGVPNAPFKTSWSELAMKRMLRYAAEHGYDKLSWDTGETNAERYDLSKQLSRVDWQPNANDFTKDHEGTLVAYDRAGAKVFSKGIKASEIPEHVGKDVADKLLHGENLDRMNAGLDAKVEGLDLKVGGEGMRGFYDKILPAFLNKYAKKWGAKVGETRLAEKNVSIANNSPAHASALGVTPVHSIDITPAMRESVMQGQPLFQGKRGSITFRNSGAIIRLMQTADASTFMHETGHHWLEELMADAGDEHATDDVRKDAQTVRDWLGTKEGEETPTKAHEKFARGFERYLMEGRAPSAALASVFEKFKAWLTDIYKTVLKLRSPINDDIRAVFDRMIAAPQGEPVIAPEEPAAPSMADTHEAQARDTPIEHAAETADRVRQEIDAARTQNGTEALDGIPRPAPETGGIAGQNEASSGGGNEAGGIASAAGAPEGTGEVAKGGNKAAPEGGAVAGRAEPTATGPERAAKPSTQRIAATESSDANARLTEKDADLAGNIHVDNLKWDDINNPDDVKEIIYNTAEANGGFMAARRGVLTDGEVLDLADAVGVDPHMIDRHKVGQAWNAEQIVALRQLLIKSARDTWALMKKAAEGGDEDILAYAEQKARHAMIQEVASAVTAEAGRALRAFRKSALEREASAGMEEGEAADFETFLKDATGRTLNQLREEARIGQRLQTPGMVARFMEDMKNHPVEDAIKFYYVNNLISGPITHFRYAVGNFIHALFTPLVEIPFAAAVGAIRGDPDRVYLGEAGHQLYAMGIGSRLGWTAAVDAFKANISEPLPGERPYANSGGMIAPIPGIAGKVIGIPGRSVTAIHSFFKTLRYEQNIAASAYRTAMREGLTGDAFDARVAQLHARPTVEMMNTAEGYIGSINAQAARIAKAEGLADQAALDRVDELVRNPTQEMKDKALEQGANEIDPQLYANAIGATRDSLRELYMAPQEYGSTMGAINRAFNNNLLLKIMVPFMKIGSQITRGAFIERTPLGIFDKTVRANLMGINGGAARDMQLGRMSGGIAVIGLSAAMCAEGMMTGDGPTDPKKRATWLLAHKPNTMTIGGISMPYQGLGSLGMLMRFTANMYETGESWEGETAGKFAWSLLEGVSKSVLDENFMRGVKDALDAVYHPEEYGWNYIKGFAANWVPFSVGLGQVARQIDPTLRDTQTLWDTIQAKIPVYSEQLMPRYDMFGRPIGEPGAQQSYENDPVVQEMDRLGIGAGRLRRTIMGVDLSEQQYATYSHLAGTMAKQQLDAIVAIPGFDNIPAAQRILMINKTFTNSREAAASMMLMSDQTLLHAAMAKKTAAIGALTQPNVGGD